MISRSSPHLVIEFHLQMMMYTIDIKSVFLLHLLTHDFRSGIVVRLDINCCFKTSIGSLHDCPHASGAGRLLIFPTESQLPTYIFILRLLNWLINLN